jgi:hypothetical protein
LKSPGPRGPQGPSTPASGGPGAPGPRGSGSEVRKFSKPAAQGGGGLLVTNCYNEHISAGFLSIVSYIWLRSKAIADEGRCIMSFDVITKEHRPHPKSLAVVQKQLLLCHIESKIYPAALLKRPDLT